MTALVSFAQSMADCELRIESAEESEPAIKRALTYCCGMAHGYYLAGAVTQYEYTLACSQLRAVADARLTIHEMRIGEAA